MLYFYTILLLCYFTFNINSFFFVIHQMISPIPKIYLIYSDIIICYFFTYKRCFPNIYNRFHSNSSQLLSNLAYLTFFFIVKIESWDTLEIKTLRRDLKRLRHARGQMLEFEAIKIILKPTIGVKNGLDTLEVERSRFNVGIWNGWDMLEAQC